MKNYILHDPWKIIEEGFDPAVNRISESIFSIGNGKFGQRGCFEETYTGDSLQGNYVAGVYYPDKTRVGWWKNGYPEYFAKVLNSPDWTGLEIKVNGELLDIANVDIQDFKRTLNMQNALLRRDVTLTLRNGITLTICSERINSLHNSKLGLIRYSITSDTTAQVEITSYIDGRIVNQDSNYNEKFWKRKHASASGNLNYLICTTKKTLFDVAIATETTLQVDGQDLEWNPGRVSKKYTSISTFHTVQPNQRLVIVKKAIITSSLDYEKNDLLEVLRSSLFEVQDSNFNQLFDAHANAWMDKWAESDIVIKGDIAAQQAIRFNIFQLNCTYTGEDERLNIGPKGFTGEKYGGSTYWDTEAYCLPFYLATADDHVARNLLIYRYKHLQKAIENARLLGFDKGAALYPMVTMNGEECHNEWEITFEEIHRNGAIAYAIKDYIRYTGDRDYLAEYGLEVLVGIARFWAQRVNWSSQKERYVILGVTGPNEFENNVNNNWYTNRIAAWCMMYAREAALWVQENHPKAFEVISNKIALDQADLEQWIMIAEKMYYPYSEEHQVYLQQDGFLDKELIPVADLPESERPIVEHWSWDRILRSCYIKQADILQGFYFFEDDFDMETLRRHYDFYEPLTVHESSLSPCVHSILAAKLGDQKRAYEFYLRTARLDLDDYNNDTSDGLHITSMAGTWMSIVIGFAGMRVHNGELTFNPFLPEQWESFSFKIRFKGEIKKITIDQNGININA